MILLFNQIHYQLFQLGLNSNSSYPYQEDVVHNKTYSCRYDRTSLIGTTTGYAKIDSGNETLLRDVIAKVGPVSVSMKADLNTFLFYRYLIYLIYYTKVFSIQILKKKFYFSIPFLKVKNGIENINLFTLSKDNF